MKVVRVLLVGKSEDVCRCKSYFESHLGLGVTLSTRGLILSVSS